MYPQVLILFKKNILKRLHILYNLGFTRIMSSKSICTICILIFCSWSICTAQDQSPSPDKKRFIRWMVKDPISFIKDFGTKELLGVGLTGLSTYALTHVDKNNSQSFQNALSNSSFLNGINDTDQPLFAGSFAMVVFGTSLLTDNTRFQNAAFTSLQSVLYNHITIGTLKFTFSRARPSDNEGVRDFDFFENTHASFPSGHTSTAFAFVTPWVMYYPHPAMYALYSIPVAVGIGRISQGEHWLSDTTTAALIGTYWGYYLSKKHLDNQNKSFDIIPIGLGKGGGIHLKVTF